MKKPIFDPPAAYLITKGEATPENFAEKRREILDVVRAAVDAGVTFVQLREKQLPARLVYELSCDAAALARGSGTSVLVNDRADIAKAAGCDGVQLTSVSLNASVVRGAFGDDFVIGVSTHSVEEVLFARDEGADFALFGPVFETPGKGAAKGIDELERVCRDAGTFPIIAVGGVAAANSALVLKAGASGFAAIRSLNDPDDIGALCRSRCSEIIKN